MATIPVPNDGSIGAVPPAWPALLTREQVCAYVGMAAKTFTSLCPVPPLALGAKILLWRRSDIDAWVAGLPVRLTRKAVQAIDAEAAQIVPAEIAGDERRFSAIARAQERALRKRATAHGR